MTAAPGTRTAPVTPNPRRPLLGSGPAEAPQVWRGPAGAGSGAGGRAAARRQRAERLRRALAERQGSAAVGKAPTGLGTLARTAEAPASRRLPRILASCLPSFSRQAIGDRRSGPLAVRWAALSRTSRRCHDACALACLLRSPAPLPSGRARRSAGQRSPRLSRGIGRPAPATCRSSVFKFSKSPGGALVSDCGSNAHFLNG